MDESQNVRKAKAQGKRFKKDHPAANTHHFFRCAKDNYRGQNGGNHEKARKSNHQPFDGSYASFTDAGSGMGGRNR